VFTSSQQLTLLVIARRSLEAAVTGAPPPRWVCSDPALNARHGVFVTIKSDGRLRGCIGRFGSELPVYQLVGQMAAAAATQDPRFAQHRLRPDELCNCHLEISLLSPMERIADPLGFEIGVHGVYVRQGTRTGCFLPQVGPESDWTREQMLSQCCARKAGIAANAWQTGEAEVFRFTAEVIEEPHVQTVTAILDSYVIQA
jgi:AmmeMemoRadiSam system protein A